MIEPTVSIIVPVYKVEAYLDRCIHSILNQTFENFEMILVDDGSSDNCPRMCDKWAEKDSRIKVIHKENGGLSSARNAGLDIASGKYISFVDSDDWLYPNCIEELVKRAKLTDADIVESGYCRIYDNGKKRIITEKEKELDQKNAYARMFRSRGERVNYYAWGRVYKKNIIKTYRFPEGMQFEDLHFNYYVMKNVHKYVVISSPLYYYFMNQSGITRGGLTEKDFQIFRIWNNIWEDGKRCHFTDEMMYYIKMNYKRSYMGMLCKYCYFGSSGLKNEKNTVYFLQDKVREYRGELLRWRMSLLKKMILLLLSVNYHLVKWPVRLLQNIKLLK